MEYDTRAIEERLRFIRDNVAQLRSRRNISFAQYQDDIVLRGFIEHSFHNTIEACLDVGKAIIREEGLRHPKDNADVFRVLCEEGIVPVKFLARLIDLARFRNVLVHEYADIEPATVYGKFKRRLGDFDHYVNLIQIYLKRVQEEKAELPEPKIRDATSGEGKQARERRATYTVRRKRKPRSH